MSFKNLKGTLSQECPFQLLKISGDAIIWQLILCTGVEAVLRHYFFLSNCVNIKRYFYHLILRYIVIYNLRVGEADSKHTCRNPEYKNALHAFCAQLWRMICKEMIKYTNFCILLYLTSPLLFKYTYISIAKNFLGQSFFEVGDSKRASLKAMAFNI